MLRFLVISIILLYTFTSCKERNQSNPFDPDNDEPYLEIGLSLNSTDAHINLYWNIPRKPHYNSIEIYRKIETEADFLLLASVSNSFTSYVDTVDEFDIKYSYYLKLIGDDVESKPTRTKSITPGPGDIWMLDDYLWEILKLNYDLSSTSLRKVGAWRPENLSFAHNINRGLITYPAFNYFEIFDLNTGNSLYGNSAITKPFDAAYDEKLNSFWLIDSLGSLYIVDTAANEQFAGRFFSKPVQIDLLENQLFVLDAYRDRIYIYDTSPSIVDSVFQPELSEGFTDLRLFRLDKLNLNLYLLDKSKGNDTLYKYNLQSREISTIFQDSLIYTFDINRQDESIWIIIANKLNSDLMQLSSSGESLLSIPGFNSPRDVKVNPYNGNVVVADITEQYNLLEQKVFHYRSNTRIGSFTTYGDPFKVYIE